MSYCCGEAIPQIITDLIIQSLSPNCRSTLSNVGGREELSRCLTIVSRPVSPFGCMGKCVHVGDFMKWFSCLCECPQGDRKIFWHIWIFLRGTCFPDVFQEMGSNWVMSVTNNLAEFIIVGFFMNIHIMIW